MKAVNNQIVRLGTPLSKKIGHECAAQVMKRPGVVKGQFRPNLGGLRRNKKSLPQIRPAQRLVRFSEPPGVGLKTRLGLS